MKERRRGGIGLVALIVGTVAAVMGLVWIGVTTVRGVRGLSIEREDDPDIGAREPSDAGEPNPDATVSRAGGHATTELSLRNGS